VQRVSDQASIEELLAGTGETVCSVTLRGDASDADVASAYVPSEQVSVPTAIKSEAKKEYVR
jgi:hypothetical protein